MSKKKKKKKKKKKNFFIFHLINEYKLKINNYIFQI